MLHLQVCEPAGGCLVDGDCTAAQFCNTVTDSCEAKLLNGTPIPTIAGHVPVLDMACNAAVGTAVCLTGVCDGTTSGVCGLGLGEGTCTSDAECRAGTCVLTAGSANLGKCEPCVGDADCASSATNKACDTTTNQCVSCTGANAAACTGSTAFCDTTTDTCTGCTGDNGSAATYACPAGAPYCNPDPVNGGACTSTCYADSDCGSASWCDAGACTPKLPNGSPIPSAPNHTPTLDGTCTSSAATAVCVSSTCDGTANTCGYANGEGPCTVDAQCTNGVCLTTGTNAGLCEACRDDSTCGGATPVCNTVTNTCAACGPSSSAQCAGVTPVCNTTGFVCVGCTADYGTSSGYSCPQSAPNCNLETGSCGTSCTTDNQCGTGRWCDANLCVAKLANGTPIPSDPSHVPTIVQVCTVQIANLICLSDTCDPTLNICGIGIGDGTCTSDDQCVSGGACSGGRCIASAVVTGDGGVVVVANPDGGTTTTIPVAPGNDDPTDHFNVLGGGCSLDPSGGANGGAELGALVTLVGLVNARRRRNRRNTAAVATKATKGAV